MRSCKQSGYAIPKSRGDSSVNKVVGRFWGEHAVEAGTAHLAAENVPPEDRVGAPSNADLLADTIAGDELVHFRSQEIRIYKWCVTYIRRRKGHCPARCRQQVDMKQPNRRTVRRAGVNN